MKVKSLIFSLFLSLTLSAQTLQEGLTALDYDKFEAARNIFTGLTEKEPTNGLNHYYLGLAYINLYKPDLAKAAFEKGISVAPTEAANYAGIGQLLLDENKIVEAKGQFDKALSFSKTKDGRYKDINALRYVADAMINAENKLLDDALNLITIALESGKKNYDLFITAGDVYIEKNDGGKSASNYEKAIDLDKNNPKAYVRVSNIWLRVKNAEATKTALDQAININQNYAPALKSLAEYYYQTKQFEKAKESYARYLENSEPSIANKQRFARILFRSKEYKDALVLINEILAVDKSDIYLYRLAGYCNYEVGNETKDTSKYRSGINMLNTFVAGVDASKIISNDYEYFGKLYSRLPGNDSLAIYYISKAIETDPSKTELIKEAGTIFYKLKKFNDAVTYFEKYISSGSKITLVDYQQLGLAAYYSGQYAKCDSAYSKILESKPDYADGYYWKGVANWGLDPEFKTDLAKDYWEKYLSLTESTPEKYKRNIVNTYSNLAAYYIQKDKNAKAKEYYKKLLDLDPQNTKAQEIMKQLK